MNEKMNKTSISSVVCLDIIDLAKKSKAEQQKIKKQFHTLLDLAVLDIPEKDRMIVDTERGAIVACNGSLESALEDALFIALTIRDEVLNSNIGNETPLYLLIGVNLGSVRVAKSTKANTAPKIVGDGLVEAQRIMSFANPNQILVSRAYYDMASKLTLEIAQMFEKYDMHAYEHDIYAVRRLNEKTDTEALTANTEHVEAQGAAATKQPFDWRIYALPMLLALIMFFVLIKGMKNDAPEKVTGQPGIEHPVLEESKTLTTEPVPVEEVKVDTAQENTGQDQPEAAQNKPAEKTKAKPKVKKKTTSKNKVKKATTRTEDKALTEPVAKPKSKKSTWETIKGSVTSGAEDECTQGEKALNQCN